MQARVWRPQGVDVVLLTTACPDCLPVQTDDSLLQNEVLEGEFRHAECSTENTRWMLVVKAITPSVSQMLRASVPATT